MADSVPAIMAPPPKRDNPLTRSVAGLIGLGVLAAIGLACLLSLPYTLGRETDTFVNQDGSIISQPGSHRYAAQQREARHLPPSWWPAETEGPDPAAERLRAAAVARAMQQLAIERGIPAETLAEQGVTPTEDQIRQAKPAHLFGTDLLGRDLFIRCLAGGGISLGIGIAAACISVLVGTLYGALAGYIGGRTDAIMMRIVDILFGLPYILLVVLLAVAVEAAVDNVQQERIASASQRVSAYVEESLARLPEAERTDDARAALREQAVDRFGTGELSAATRQGIGVVTLLVAIGGVSWLTMARVVRGQVLSLKAQPFIEAARAMGVPLHGVFLRHLLPNLLGPIIVYATLTVPQAILQESFLSFLGIGVKPPLPSWGNLAADGLLELNPYKSNWWLLAFPCLLLGTTLLALNFVGEGLREAFDPKRARR